MSKPVRDYQKPVSSPHTGIQTVLRRTKREYWLSELRVATGRSAIRHLMNVVEPRYVLMPSYVPEGVIGPCRQAAGQENREIIFYKLNPDLTPDLTSIVELMMPGAMVIVIHYFGYLTDCSEIRDIVDAADGLLFEDCAHALYDEVAKANYADVALWSLNKFMPVTDGAILRSRNKRVNVRPIFALQAPHQDFWRLYHEHLDATAKMVEEGDFSLLPKSESAYEEYYRRIGTDYRTYAQSEESKFIESQFDIKKEETIRSVNAWRMRMILPGLRKNSGLPQFAFPMMCDSPRHRETVIERITKLNVLPATQIAKWDHVPRDGNHTAELDFMGRHLLLPLGDSMDQETVGQISGAL